VNENHFGDDVAETYDAEVAEEFTRSAIDSVVTMLAEFATDGGALELGIGTGRIALPLSERGIDVEGIDLSASMVEKMRLKPGGRDIRVVLGDFASASMDRTFDVVYLVFNTIMNLTSQQEQIACFANAAAHLRPGGRFVVEVMVPDLRRMAPGESVRPFKVRPDAFGFDEYDVANQGLISHHYRVRDNDLESRSIPFRYVWPSELDLMATMAGMVLLDRWGGWQREPFTSESRQHVSVWEKSS
jgi:SAM-dependent methyltransferase